MPALGHKQTYAVQKAMSALLPIATAKADMPQMVMPALHPKAGIPANRSAALKFRRRGSADMPPVLTHIRVSFVKPDGTEVDDLDEATKP